MRKTSAFGVVYPQASISLNWPTTAQLCQATGTTALSTTLTPYTFTCTTPAAVTLTVTDRLTLFAGYHLTDGPGNKSMKVELAYEGVLGGNYEAMY